MARKKMGADKLVVQNAAKTLLANIRFASVDDPIRVITITSSTPNEGKSTVALNLAQAIATSGKSVVLVECDMRRRSMGQMIGVRSRGGLYAVLSEQMKLEEAVVETSQKNLYFLDSEPHIPNPADIIASRRFKRLVERLAHVVILLGAYELFVVERLLAFVVHAGLLQVDFGQADARLSRA